MFGKAFIFAAGLGVGFVVGTRQGRAAYDRLKGQVQDAWNSPRVQRRVDDAQTFLRDNVPVVGDVAADAIDKTKSPTPLLGSSTAE